MMQSTATKGKAVPFPTQSTWGLRDRALPATMVYSVARGGALVGMNVEKGLAIAVHESPSTTKLYDRPANEIGLAEIKRIVI